MQPCGLIGCIDLKMILSLFNDFILRLLDSKRVNESSRLKG